MNKNFKRKYSKGSFLFATFCEFVKCWGSGAKSRLFIESVKGNAFVNFSAFLGHPGNAHFVPKREEEVETRAREGNPDGQQKSKPRKKSKRKTERDNLRAAKFQEKKTEGKSGGCISCSDLLSGGGGAFHVTSGIFFFRTHS